MILYSASFKPKGFGIKKYLKIYKNDIALVTDKISKRKRRKLEKYIVSVSNKLLNNSHLDICSYGCLSDADIVSQVCEILFTQNTDLSLNDINGYAAETLKKHIKNFSSVRIYGSKIYKDMQEELYVSNGICIIIANDKIKNAIDTDSILEKARNTFYYDGGVNISYLDMLKYYGINHEVTAKFISMISQCKNS